MSSYSSEWQKSLFSFYLLPLLSFICLIIQLPHHTSYLSPSPCPFVLSFKQTYPLIWWHPHHSQNPLCCSFFCLPLIPVTGMISCFLLFSCCCTWQLSALRPLPSSFPATRLHTDNPLIHQLLLLYPETARAPFHAVISPLKTRLG